ncbi:MAG: helix-turn-helix transcriptional regulator [Rhodospirillaceae bacterium]|nr:helix-turn-helix transcriptional regulator [Rhodospirillaceae bacterium]
MPTAPFPKTTADAGTHTENGTTVGQQVREMRRARGMTLQQLADGIGRSVGYVSQVERNISSVDIRNLHEIAGALGVGINWFFQGDGGAAADEHGVVVRRGRRRKLDFPGAGITEELLSPGLNGAFEMILGTFQPGAQAGEKNYSRPGEEAGLVLQGELELWVGDTRYHLHEGDSFQFPLNEPHRSRNPGETQAVVLWVIAPPTY